ncbi:hypothetical protein HPP92_026087 [Vanilla planifolia]|uniref:Uncharacterized protein n=1 Tax=Vanilla planifolia TaxID=51239 RepID=A0A835PHW2_VANPL|nr:hypothetical protein HPP92_026087 [Vanilla planifolia]
MKILSWVQSKISGRKGRKIDGRGSNQYTSKQNACKEEFNDWPQAFLAIGTFGNYKSQVDEQMPRSLANQEPSQEDADLMIEEVIKLEMEISELLKLKVGDADGEKAFNCSSALENGQLSLPKTCCGSTDDTHNLIRKRSVSFLVKKMLDRRIGFFLRPSLNDPVPEQKMEKIAMKMLRKKSRPRAIPRAPTTKCSKRSLEEEKEEKGSKWVNTDSEYIVLEI